MRLATLAIDYWELLSAEEQHLAHPKIFWIPPLQARQSVTRGQAVKLHFDIEYESQGGEPIIQGERIWVLVAEKINDIYIGRLLNQPALLNPEDDVYLRLGAEVPFLATHVMDIDAPPPEAVEQINQQLLKKPTRLWPRA